MVNRYAAPRISMYTVISAIRLLVSETSAVSPSLVGAHRPARSARHGWLPGGLRLPSISGGYRAADTRRPVTSRDDDCAAQLPLAASPG
jgi:hypothetical protein